MGLARLASGSGGLPLIPKCPAREQASKEASKGLMPLGKSRERGREDGGKTRKANSTNMRAELQKARVGRRAEQFPTAGSRRRANDCTVPQTQETSASRVPVIFLLRLWGQKQNQRRPLSETLAVQCEDVHSCKPAARRKKDKSEECWQAKRPLSLRHRSIRKLHLSGQR